CPTLFRTQDAGLTWQRLPAAGFGGGLVLLPPTYPADPTIFVQSPDGLGRSDDGGQSFQVALPIVGPAAIAPASVPGNATVAIASTTIMLYHASGGSVEPGPSLPPGMTPPDAISYADPTTLLVTADRVDPVVSGQQDGVILRCSGA